jgi:hypothetical protein
LRRGGSEPWFVAAFVPSGDHLIQILAGLAVLLFLSRGLLARGRGRYDWTRWAKWGAVAAFAAAVGYALVVIVLWAFGAAG